MTMLLLGVLSQLGVEAQATTRIKASKKVDGSVYSSTYAKKLNKIFRGEVALFSNSKVKYALGDKMKTRATYRVADAPAGSQCYIYAQGVYYYLFGDVVYHGEGYKYWSDSKMVLSNKKTVSYEMFVKAKVGFGAYMRTTSNSNGSYNGSKGHSMILLSYDKEKITYLEGNADGRGLICVTEQTWSEFNASHLAPRGRRISHIVQCKSAMCAHTSYSKLGECKKCGEAFDFAATFNAEAAGLYAVTATGGVSVRSEMPYDGAKEAFFAEKGLRLNVLGSVTNAQGVTWYEVSYQGKTGFVKAKSLKKDTVTPGTPVLKATAEAVDNKPIAFTWAATANTTHYELRINAKNAAGKWGSYRQVKNAVSGTSCKLPAGEYRIQLLAYNKDAVQPDGTGALYTASKIIKLTVEHGHSYTTLVVTEASCTTAGAKQLTCEACGESDSKQIPVEDHSYVDHQCVTCDKMEPTVVNLTVSAKASTGKPVLSWNKVSGEIGRAHV